MRELKRKTFLTIFLIITAFLLVSVVFVNVSNYKRESESIRRNLNIMDGRGMKPENGGMPPEGEPPQQDGEPQDLEHMMFMDHEVYTVELNGTEVTRVISHAPEASDFDAASIAVSVVELCKTETTKVENLFLGGYAFHFKPGASVVIVNLDPVARKLRSQLLLTLCIFGIAVFVVAAMTRLMTGWITKPAAEALSKQRAFIADASHELKTPLAVIMASADELETTESNAPMIENIKYESDRMNRLITGLLDLSKLDAGTPEDAFREENLSAIIEKTCLVFEAVAFEQGVTIDTKIEEGIRFSCIREEMEKLASTLIDNALKHSEKDSSIRVGLKRERGTIRFTVTNTGEPIPEGDEEKIFERFYRGSADRNRNENRYGLGLAIAKSIVTGHGGTIRAASARGKTTFTVEM